MFPQFADNVNISDNESFSGHELRHLIVAMTDRRNSIGRIPYDKMQGFGIAEGCFSENGDGYLSDVQTFHSNNPSEVSQDLYHSNRVLEQHFKNKYRFLRNAYEQRIIKLSDVVRVTCENLFTDELLHEMMGEKISSVFIPAHIGEVINHHLESDREQFIHEIISQLSSTKVDLLKCQEALAQKCKAIAILEPEVSRGQRSQSGMDCLQKQHVDLKRKFDNLTINSAEKINTMQTKNTILEEQDRTSKENLQKNLSELTLKSSEVESLKGEIAVVTREYSLLETSFERTLNDEVRSKLSSYLSVNNDLSLEVNELKLQIRLKVDELTRTHDALRLKTEEEQSSRSQVTSIMTQVEGMLDDEASESNKTINAIHDKMKLLKSRLSTELQQERKLTAVLQAELGNVRRDKEEEIRQNRLATEESVLLREKLSTEVLKSTSMQAKAQECHNLLVESKARILQAENNSKVITEELANANRLKLQEIKTEVAKARIEALKELEIERSKIDALVASRTAEFKKSYDKQLRTLQNQMRHSYTFGSTVQDYDKMNETHVRNKSLNISHTDDTVNYDENTDSDALAANLSMQFAMRKYAEKSTVAKILVESENLIAKAKSEARIENCHQEIVKELQDKLQQAAGEL